MNSTQNSFPTDVRYNTATGWEDDNGRNWQNSLVI